MKTSFQAETAPEWEILRWAAGACIAVPQYGEVDERRLLDWVVAHRLGPRLLHRLKRENVRPRWLSDGMLQHLRGQNAKTRAQIELRMRALREICAALPDAPPLLIKGFSAYAATGEHHFIRPSGDMDLMAHDTEQLSECLSALGYGLVAADASAHEYATAARTSIGIEIHRFFPVYAFPPGVEDEDFAPENHPNLWLQEFAPPPRREMRYSDIWKNAVCGQTPATRGLHFPDPATAAFILCAHEFRELLLSPFELPIPVRLALLADIHDLAQRDDFDTAHFCALVERFDGAASVRLVGHFLQTVFNANPLPGPACEYSHNQRLPRQIAFRGGWASLGTAREWLLGLDRATILQRLGANRIAAGANHEAIFYTLENDACEGIRRAVVHTLSGAPFALRFSLAANGSGLALKVLLPVLCEENVEYRIRLDGAGQSGLGHAVNIGESGDWEQNGDGQAALAVEDDGYQLQISLPSPIEPLLLLLTVMKRDRRIADFYNAECVVSVPLEIVRAEGTND